MSRITRGERFCQLSDNLSKLGMHQHLTDQEIVWKKLRDAKIKLANEERSKMETMAMIAPTTGSIGNGEHKKRKRNDA